MQINKNKPLNEYSLEIEGEKKSILCINAINYAQFLLPMPDLPAIKMLVFLYDNALSKAAHASMTSSNKCIFISFTSLS